MRVLAAVVVAPHAKISGAVNAAKELSAALRSHCDIELGLISQEERLESWGGLSVRHVRGRLPFAPLLSRLPNKFKVPFYRSDLSELVQSGHYDLVHLHNAVPALELLRISESCRRKGIPYVVSTHGFVEISNGGHALSLGPLERLAFRHLIWNPVKRVVENAAGVLIFSPADIPIVEDLGGKEVPMVVAPNGVHSPPPLSDERLDEVRKHYHLTTTGNTPVLLYLGSHARNKGLPHLLDAVADSRHNFTLLVAGEKRPHIDYEAATRRLNSGQRVEFLGYVPDDLVHYFYRLADILVFPSLADTFPLVVLEAMRSGLAIVASKVGGTPYQLADDSGILVDPGDTTALTAAIDKMISDPEARAALGSRARLRAEKQYSWARSAQEAYKLYESVIEGLPAGD